VGVTLSTVNIEAGAFQNVRAQIGGALLRTTKWRQASLIVLGKPSRFLGVNLSYCECRIMGPVILDGCELLGGSIEALLGDFEAELCNCRLQAAAVNLLMQGGEPAKEDEEEGDESFEKREATRAKTASRVDATKAARRYPRVSKCTFDRVKFLGASLSEDELHSCSFTDCEGILLVRAASRLPFDGTGVTWVSERLAALDGEVMKGGISRQVRQNLNKQLGELYLRSLEHHVSMSFSAK
jgi:hypothetical protein